MAFVTLEIYQAAVQLSPARRHTLNLRKRKLAAQRLAQCCNLSWCTEETLNHVSNTAVTCTGGVLLFLFVQCLLHKWRKHKGSHPVASRYASLGTAVYRKVAGRVHRVWRKQKHSLKKKASQFKLWCMVYYYLIYGMASRVWFRCKHKLVKPLTYYTDRGKCMYHQITLSVYQYVPILRVSAVVIFLHLFCSGDVELNPGPIDGKVNYNKSIICNYIRPILYLQVV